MTDHLQQLDEEELIISWQALKITNSLAFPMVFKAAMELGVIDTIAATGNGVWMSSFEIASSLPTKPTNPDAPLLLDRMLRLLVSHSILKCRLVKTNGTGDSQMVYAAEPVCTFFLKRDDHSGVLSSPCTCCTIAKYISTHGTTKLKDMIQEGKDAFSSAHDMKLFEYVGLDQEFGGMFNQAMSESSTMVMKKILKAYKGFKDLNTLVDIGGGFGTVLNLVTSTYPQIKGINFDLAMVIQNAPSHQGVEHVSGDMFIGIPKGDAIFMKWILHDWNDEDCVKILKNCWKSLPEKGKVIIVELVTPIEPKSGDYFSNIVLGLDMLMLTICSGGKERSFSEFEALASSSGFVKCEMVCLAYAFSVIEFHK